VVFASALTTDARDFGGANRTAYTMNNESDFAAFCGADDSHRRPSIARLIISSLVVWTLRRVPVVLVRLLLPHE
jgi:hypothetical protein